MTTGIIFKQITDLPAFVAYKYIKNIFVTQNDNDLYALAVMMDTNNIVGLYSSKDFNEVIPKFHAVMQAIGEKVDIIDIDSVVFK